MVALTPKSARALGVPLTEADAARPFVEMSGRRGLGIKADDLLDALEARAAREVADRNPDLEGGAAAVLGRQIAIGALRYLMIKYTRNKVLAFDFDEALSFEGESGPYLQYAVVRAASILRNLAAGGPDEAAAAGLARDGRFDLPEGEDADEHWALLVQMARFRETVAQAADGLELSQIAKYAFALAQRFNSFYHRYPVLKENDPRWRQARIALIWMFHARMRQICDLIGVPVPERM
jgi:arginyl-tRNA synthetase